MDLKMDFNVYKEMDDEQRKMVEGSQLYESFVMFRRLQKLKAEYSSFVIDNPVNFDNEKDNSLINQIADVEDKILDAVHNIHYMMSVNDDLEFKGIHKDIYDIANELYELKYDLYDILDKEDSEDKKREVFTILDKTFLNDIEQMELVEKHTDDDMMDLLR